jgi:hypothetical protein
VTDNYSVSVVPENSRLNYTKIKTTKFQCDYYEWKHIKLADLLLSEQENRPESMEETKGECRKLDQVFSSSIPLAPSTIFGKNVSLHTKEDYLISLKANDSELEEMNLKLVRSKIFMNMIIHDIKHPAISFQSGINIAQIQLK